MEGILLDDREIESLIERRREMGADRYDEVWDGVFVLAPLATNEHQRLAAELTRAFLEVAPAGAVVLPGANVSDRDQDWRHNYRCPDVVVVLAGSAARDAGTHWVGGPDLVVEIVSPNDRSEAKLEFYRATGVREVLLVDRDSKLCRLFAPAATSSRQCQRRARLPRAARPASACCQ